MLEIKNVTKRYKKGSQEFIALDDMSIKVEKGDYVSVTGPSGAGKSTLLYIVGGLVRPDTGEVIYDGVSIYERNGIYLDLYRKADVGFMFQQFHLLPYLTVDDNIKLACSREEHYDAVEMYLEKCSISGVRNKYPSELSVGEKQRTAFIRAIITKPAMLLADEPTGNLDPGNSEVLMSLLGDYNKEGGSVIIVSHDRLAASYADRNIVLEKGRIKA